MENKIIAFDESGNTGQNLLDENQPFFALASVKFDDKQLDELFNLFDSTAKELHFKSLKKYSKSRKQIIDLCNHDLITFENVKFYVTEKKIALIGHIVDRFIEPVMYKIGKDIYKDRSNIIITNILYTFCNKAWDKNLVNNFLLSFQNFIRNPSDETIDEFYEVNSDLIKSIPDKGKLSFLNIIDGSKNLRDQIISHIEPYTIDLTMPTFNVLTHKWYEEINTTFEIIHDDSKAIEFWETMINMLANPELMEEKKVGFGKNTITYPLKFSKLSLVNSKEYRQVQIADILASSLCFGLKNQSRKHTDEFVKELWGSKLFNIEHSSMRALDEKILTGFIEGGDQQGTNSLDYLAEMQLKNEREN